MLFEEGVTMFLGYMFIGLACFIDGSPLTVGTSLLATWFILSPMAGTSFMPLWSVGQVYEGKRSVQNMFLEIAIGIAACYVSWYVADTWKSAHPNIMKYKYINTHAGVVSPGQWTLPCEAII